jgi:ABC-type branched-subunit amino acid transport system substrate-binding protein
MSTPNRLLRLLGVFLALSLVAAACGDDDDEPTEESTEESTEETTEETTEEGGGEPEAAPGFDGETIRLGVLTPQTGVAAVIGNPLTNGNRVFFEALNAQGGIAGKYQVELEIADTQYQPQTAVQQYNSTKGDVVGYVQVLGTPVVNGILPLLEEDEIVAGPASLDSFWVPEQYLLALGGPYQLQAVNAMDYWFNQEGNDPADTTVCTMIQDDPYGEAGQAGIEFAGEEVGFEVAETARFAATDTDFSGQINTLRSGGCELVFLVSLPSATGAIVGAAAQQQFAPQWIGQSPTWVGALAQSPVGPYLEENFLLMSEGPEWGDTSSEGMAQMIEDLEAYAPDQDPDIYFSFGYAQAWSWAQVLERAVELGDLSREGIVEAMNTVGTITTGGLLGDYEYGPPEERVPPRESRVFAIDAEAPGGLRAVSEEFVSEAAEAFEFEFES